MNTCNKPERAWTGLFAKWLLGFLWQPSVWLPFAGNDNDYQATGSGPSHEDFAVFCQNYFNLLIIRPRTSRKQNSAQYNTNRKTSIKFCKGEQTIITFISLISFSTTKEEIKKDSPTFSCCNPFLSEPSVAQDTWLLIVSVHWYSNFWQN